MDGTFLDLVIFLHSRVGELVRLTMLDSDREGMIWHGRLEVAEEHTAAEPVFLLVGGKPRSLRLHPAMVSNVSLAEYQVAFTILGTPLTMDFPFDANLGDSRFAG